MKCVECGAEVTEFAELCDVCGAPPIGPRPVPADPGAAMPGDRRATAARDVVFPPAWVRRGQPYYMISLIFFLALYMMGWFGFLRTEGPGSGLHRPMEWVIGLGVAGALLSLALFEAARGQFRARQLMWALMPLLSWTFLAFVPFLWLALIRRRTREWVVFSVYLAAEATLLALSISHPGANDTWNYEILAGLLAIAPIHAVLAFSPAVGAATWRESRAATDGAQ